MCFPRTTSELPFSVVEKMRCGSCAVGSYRIRHETRKKRQFEIRELWMGNNKGIVKEIFIQNFLSESI